MNYGIDLGTTNSCVASWNEKMGQPEILPNVIDGNIQVTPSIVYFDPDHKEEVLVGSKAWASFNLRPDRTVRGIKRRMRDKDSYDPQVNGIPEGNDPVSISSLILKKLKQDAMDGHQQDVRDVVITIPAYFGDIERIKTKQAGIDAGLNVLEIIPEPTAAALYYGLATEGSKNILVYDLGGGTFDVTFVRIIERVNEPNVFRYVAIDGDSKLGGLDWDRELAQMFLEQYNRKVGSSYSLKKEEDLTDDGVEARLTATLLKEAEEVKKLFGPRVSHVKRSISFDGTTLEVDVTVDEFNNRTKHLLDRTIEKTRGVIKVAEEKGFKDIDEIILVGGSTRMPQVTSALRNTFGINPKICNPDFAVAAGAAIYANTIGQYVNDEEGVKILNTTSPVIISNILSKTYGFMLIDGSVGNFLFKNKPLPIEMQVNNRFTIARDGQKEVSLELYESDYLETPENLNIPRSDVEAKSTRIAECTVIFNKAYSAGTVISMNVRLNNEQLIEIDCDINGDSQSVKFDLSVQDNPNRRKYIDSVEIK